MSICAPLPHCENVSKMIQAHKCVLTSPFEKCASGATFCLIFMPPQSNLAVYGPELIHSSSKLQAYTCVEWRDKYNFDRELLFYTPYKLGFHIYIKNKNEQKLPTQDGYNSGTALL